MARHARFDDGSVAVRLWNGSAAIFDETGAWKRDVKLAPGAPADALDAFAASGATYAVALGKSVQVVDLASGEDHTTELASAPKSLAVSPDGKTVLVALADGTVSAIAGGAATPLAHAKGARVGFAGKSMLVWSAKDVLDAWAPGASSPLELVLDASGVVVQHDAGAFEVRGKPEVACVVGKTFLSRETCGDRAKDGLVGDWLRATR
jgi:DNA-binding beta-propeller fold protein YncE